MKNPIKLIPHRKWLEARAVEIQRAIEQRKRTKKDIPIDWCYELAHIKFRIIQIRNKGLMYYGS